MEQFRGTTILSVRRDDNVVIGGDGQVSLGDTVMKGNARKVRRLYNEQILAGFAGGTADEIISTVINHYPDLSGNSELWFAGLPDNLNGAYIFRLGIDAALQLRINDTGLVAHSLSSPDEIPKNLTPDQYAFIYQDGQLLDLTPDYRVK